MMNATTIGAGLGRPTPAILAWGLGITWESAVVIPFVQPSPYYKLHGFNQYRLLQWGGRYKRG